MNILILKFSLAILTCLFLLYCHVKYQSNVIPIQPEPQKPPVEKRWVLAILLVCITFYAFLAYVISLAWLQGDEFLFVDNKELSLFSRLEESLIYWMNANGRFGDILGRIITLSESRWQQYLITPLFIVATPFTIWQLIRPIGESIFTRKGLLYIIFTISILTISVQTSPWRNFWDYAASINYLWPCVIICYFLSFFRTDALSKYKRTNIISKILIPALFFMGMYCGWSLECVTLFLLPGLIIWLLWQYKTKNYVPFFCLAGILGVIIGACCLLSSPGLTVRGANELSHITLNIQTLSTIEKLEFALNHSTENLSQLRGITVKYYLGGLPLWMHIFYIPELLSSFITCCFPVLGACIFMALTYYKSYNKHFTTIFWSLLALSVLMACSYLYAVIPSYMSFLPPTFCLLILSAYLFTRFYLVSTIHLFIRRGMCIITVIYSLVVIIPSATEAMEYKKYETQRRQAIRALVSQGIVDISLPPPYSIPPKDKLGLISSMDLKSNSASYPNIIAVDVYGAKSISQAPSNNKQMTCLQ